MIVLKDKGAHCRPLPVVHISHHLHLQLRSQLLGPEWIHLKPAPRGKSPSGLLVLGADIAVSFHPSRSVSHPTGLEDAEESLDIGLARATDLSELNHPISQMWKLRTRKGTLPSPRSHSTSTKRLKIET